MFGLSRNNNEKWIVFGLAVAITSLWLVTISESSLGWKIMVWVTVSIMIIIMVYMTGILILKLLGMGKQFANKYVKIEFIIFQKPYEIKNMLFTEYTY
jgi:hypothetical protein